MRIINAADYGIRPGGQVGAPLARLFKSLEGDGGEKTIRFESGTYHISAQDCEKHMLYITNTAADSEYSSSETPHLAAAAFYLSDVKNTVIDGCGSVFIIDGKATNMALEGCEGITLQNLELRHSHPDMHRLTVVKKRPFYVDFEADCDSTCKVENGRLYFYGSGWRSDASKNALTARWIGLVRRGFEQDVRRVSHPLFGALRIRQNGERRFRVWYSCTARFKLGDAFFLYDVRRQYAGIFLNRCKDVRLFGVKQRFNYSLALVCQCCRGVELYGCEFAPEQNSPRLLASCADFIQVCMCRGGFKAENCVFCGAGDDCLNVHGIHFKIIKKRGSTVTVRFMHPQTHGFDPFEPGDEIAFINPRTLLEEGRASLISSRLLNEYELELELDDASQATPGLAAEDVSACPEVRFVGNTLSRIITRGVLVTTRGRVRIENNRFISTSMSAVLLSDDAQSWYESGMCRDVLIKNNIFERCGQTPVLIKPENSVHAGAVHKNIRIEGNFFPSGRGECVRAKSSGQITLSGNSYSARRHIKAVNCTRIFDEPEQGGL